MNFVHAVMNSVVICYIAGKNLGEMGITPANTKDDSGCNRFQRYNLNYVSSPQKHTVPSSAHSLLNQIVSPHLFNLLSSTMKTTGVKQTFMY